MKDIYMLLIIISGSALTCMACVWLDRMPVLEKEPKVYKPLEIPKEYKTAIPDSVLFQTVYEINIKGVTIVITKEEFENLRKANLVTDLSMAVPAISMEVEEVSDSIQKLKDSAATIKPSYFEPVLGASSDSTAIDLSQKVKTESDKNYVEL